MAAPSCLETKCQVVKHASPLLPARGHHRQPPLDELTPSACADCRSTLELRPVEIGRPTSHVSVVASLIEQGRFTTGKNRSVVVFRALLDLDLVIKLQDGDRSAPESALCRLDTTAREVFT